MACLTSFHFMFHVFHWILHWYYLYTGIPTLFCNQIAGRRFPRFGRMVLKPEENDYTTRMVMLCDPTASAEELEASLDGVLGEAGITLLHEASDEKISHCSASAKLEGLTTCGLAGPPMTLRCQPLRYLNVTQRKPALGLELFGFSPRTSPARSFRRVSTAFFTLLNLGICLQFGLAGHR